MNEIVIISGKGGTGKTSIAASFAAIGESEVLADCDVDASDLHLVLSPTVVDKGEFWSGKKARIEEEKCNECGLCQELCRFNAIKDFKVDHLSCEGCGFCFHACPAGAIVMEDVLSGHWFASETRYGPLVHARLIPGEENSGKLVALVRQKAKALAEEKALKYIITDGPPGIGCPVISSLSGAAMALLVAEPTMSGVSDLERAVGVCNHFGIPAAVCINKYDLNEEIGREIERYCSQRGIELIGKLPFDEAFVEAISKGVPVVEYSKGSIRNEIERMWETIATRVKKQ
ncbi:MAG TPA: ATP-binding protein [Thermosynergistes sp.]|nr:ATP-binding protein [Thermosynergistes sp.]